MPRPPGGGHRATTVQPSDGRTKPWLTTPGAGYRGAPVPSPTCVMTHQSHNWNLWVGAHSCCSTALARPWFMTHSGQSQNSKQHDPGDGPIKASCQDPKAERQQQPFSPSDAGQSSDLGPGSATMTLNAYALAVPPWLLGIEAWLEPQRVVTGQQQLWSLEDQEETHWYGLRAALSAV